MPLDVRLLPPRKYSVLSRAASSAFPRAQNYLLTNTSVLFPVTDGKLTAQSPDFSGAFVLVRDICFSGLLRTALFLG